MQFGWSLVLLCVVSCMGCSKDDKDQARVQQETPPATAARETTQNAPEKTPAAAPAADPALGATESDLKDNEKTAEEANTATETSTGGPTAGGPTDTPALGKPYLLSREGLQIAELILSRGIEKTDDRKRIPIEPGHSFTCDDRRVYAIFEMKNPSEQEGELQVGWIKPGGAKEGNIVNVSIKPNKSWRTWAFNKYVNKMPGIWQVVVRDSDDTILARAAFDMKK